MKVVAILGGLGSQMFKYAMYLQFENDSTCYIDTMPFELTEMWNGYELERIFGIQAPNLATVFNVEEIKKFKEDGLTYIDTCREGIIRLEPFSKPIRVYRGYFYDIHEAKKLAITYKIYNALKRIKYKKDDIKDTFPKLLGGGQVSFYIDEFNHTSDFYIRNERIKLKRIFCFPKFTEKENISIARRMLQEESVAVHIRRSDHMYDNGSLYDSGYFPKSIKFIKDNTNKPIFYLFSDEPIWCRNNFKNLGLEDNDRIIVVDWNGGKQSFRDMQLMTFCQHNVLAISSFSWWGYYLSDRENKLICAPKGYWLEVAKHF